MKEWQIEYYKTISDGLAENTARYKCPRCREVTERHYEQGDKAPMCCSVRTKRIG